MKPWTFEQLRQTMLSHWVHRGDREFSGRLSIDSRQVKPGDLFIALRGRNHDGHRFIRQAVGAGAAGALVEQPLDAPTASAVAQASVTVLGCASTLAALNRLSAAYRGDICAKVIAVGGSNGKTTTKRIIDTLLTQRFYGLASPKSFNNNIGLPLTLLSVEPEHEYVVLEVGTNAPGEVAALGQVARPDIAVITGVDLEHLEFLGDLPAIAREEASLARFVRPGGMLIYANHSPELNTALRLVEAARCTVRITPGLADLQADPITIGLEGSHFVVNGRTLYHVPLLGRPNVCNALLAIAVAQHMGLSPSQIAAGLAAVVPAPMRLQLQRWGRRWVLNDAYNANPGSMAAALEIFTDLTFPTADGRPARRVAILGDMLELGLESEAQHRAVGRRIAGLGLGLFIAVGSAMKYAAEEAGAAGVPLHYFPDTAQAAKAWAALLGPDDAILLKASRAMELETLLTARGDAS